MGGLGGSSSKPKKSASNEYVDDAATRMPVLNSASSLNSMRRTLRNLGARSGRASTRMVNDAGIRPYVSSLLGSTN